MSDIAEENKGLIDTYDRDIQLGASDRRYEDALALQSACRWNGAMYLAGYAIECSLKSLICYTENKTNFKETSTYIGGRRQRANLHDLGNLLRHARGSNTNSLAALDRTYTFEDAIESWTQKKEEWRYGDEVGNKDECKSFIENVESLRDLILEELYKLKLQGEDIS